MTKDDDDDPLSVRTTKHSKTPVHNIFHCSLMLRLAVAAVNSLVKRHNCEVNNERILMFTIIF